MTTTISIPRANLALGPLNGVQRWIAFCIAVVLCAVAIANLMPLTYRSSPNVRWLAWQPAIEGEAPSASGWRAYEMRAGTDGSPIWVRATIELSAAEAEARTAALTLPGAFSARAWLNGIEIGSKGSPAFSAADERPGPIDAALPLGAAARAGINEVALLMSAHNAHYRPEALLQGLEVLPQGGDGERPLSRYAVALSQVGVLLAIVAAFVALALRRREDKALPWVVTGAAFLLVAMAAETARVWWSYPYPYHVVRLSVVWLSLAGFGVALTYAAVTRFASMPSVLVSAVSVGLLLVVLALVPGLDGRSVLALIASMAAVVLVVRQRASTGDMHACALTIAALVTATLLVVRGSEVVDNWIYVLGALMLATFARVPRAEQAPAPTLALEGETVAVADIVLMKAAGNYAEIHTTTGRKHFLRKALSELEAGAPLMRVHRSYIVNLDRAHRFVAKTGSRYALELGGGEAVPVSRKLADAVRTALAKRDASAQDNLNRRTSH